MAEVMGVISSVLAISEAVIGSVKLASELYRAPEEIRALDVRGNFRMWTSAKSWTGAGSIFS
jgi:hypothetical protein